MRALEPGVADGVVREFRRSPRDGSGTRSPVPWSPPAAS